MRRQIPAEEGRKAVGLCACLMDKEAVDGDDEPTREQARTN